MERQVRREEILQYQEWAEDERKRDLVLTERKLAKQKKMGKPFVYRAEYETLRFNDPAKDREWQFLLPYLRTYKAPQELDQPAATDIIKGGNNNINVKKN